MTASRVSGFPAGQLIDDRFRLEELIGRGGTAEVFRAYDERGDRRLALKRGLTGSPRLIERRRLSLEREYYTLAQLAHPRIIEVYDFGVDDTGAYYTMELLEGGDLADAGPWAWRRACALLVDVASSLAILHSRGLLHRDVSARNVRRTHDDRAKLIDFGALSSIGLALDVVGTPPFVSPEALQMQALDARADLYAVGALAYYLLSGRHAYGARKLSELRDRWRSAPLPLARLVPEAPPALSTLVMRLLSLDRTARPASAAEVMRRLCALADLPVQEDLEVSRAYLTTPMLVGRQQLQLATHKLMLRMARSEGATVIFEGPPGSGRSRALDACVLDGRLLGAQVARANASIGAQGEWAVAKALCAQLFQALPVASQAASRSLTPWLGSMLAELRGEPASGPWPQRNALIRGLRELVLALGDRERLLLAVDDADRIDEPSLAFLAALAGHTESRPIVLALSLDSDSRERKDISLQLLRAQGESIPLAALNAEQTEALLRSVFGETANLPLVAARVHALSQGNPRATLELAQHLVQRGLARYEVGAWLLPAEISETDLPRTMALSLLARVSALSADARELCDFTAIADRAALSTRDYEQLCPVWERSRVYAALQGLLTARVLLAQADAYCFTQRGFVAVVNEALSPERLREIHGRYADMLEAQGADVLLRAHHLLEAERSAECIALLLKLDLRVRHARVSLLSRAYEAALQLQLPVLTLRELRMGLLTSAVFALDVKAFLHWAQPALEALKRESGLELYNELADLPSPQRLTDALTRTQQQYLALPEQQRGFPVDEAIRRLVRLANGYSAMAAWTFDSSVLDLFPSLAPLTPLAPAIDVISQMLAASYAWVAGSLVPATSIYQGVLDRLEAPDAIGVDGTQRALMRNLCHQLLGMIKASLGNITAEQHAREMEKDRAFRMSAWRIRQLFQISQGDMVAARSCRRQADLLKLQEGFEQIAAAGTDGVELMAYTRLRDVAGVQTALAGVEMLAAQHPGWVPVKLYGQAEFYGMHGEWERALQLAKQGLELARPGRHWCYSNHAALHVSALNALGRTEEAVEVGLVYRRSLAIEQLPGSGLAVALAQALTASGRYEEAFAQLEDAINGCSAVGMTGVILGNLFEQAAYVTLAARDQARFEVTLAACALEYKKGHNPLLGARLTRLVEAAQQHNLRMIHLLPLLDDVGAASVLAERSGEEALRNRFAECVDQADRAHCALSLVLQQAQRSAGYLYAATDSGLVALGGIPDDASPQRLDAWIRVWFEGLPKVASSPEEATETVEAVSDVEITTQTGRAVASDVSGRLVLPDGREFEALPLLAADDSERAIVGVFVLEVEQARHHMRLMPTRHLLVQIGEALRTHGDMLGC